MSARPRREGTGRDGTGVLAGPGPAAPGFPSTGASSAKLSSLLVVLKGEESSQNEISSSWGYVCCFPKVERVREAGGGGDWG